MAFILDEYAPRKFSDKYEKYLAPSGQLWTPEKVFTNKRLGPDGEENLKKAFKITIKKLKKMRQLCANCGNKEGKLKFCKGCNALMYCNDECMEKRLETHERVCDDLRKEIIDQVVECFPSPIAMGQDMLKSKGGNVEGWEDWFSRHTDLRDRINAGAELINKWWEYTTLGNPGVEVFRESLERIMTSMFTTILTIGHSIYWFPSDSTQFAGCKEIHIHLIGADQPEIAAVESGMIEVSSRCVGRPMVVTLIAPNIEKYPETADWTPQNPHQITPMVKCVAYTGLYHEFWADHIDTQNIMNKMERPNVCMAIHPGVHTEDMFELWVPTLELLQKERVPLVMTTYSRYEFEETMELKMDEMYQNVVFKGENPLGSQHTKQTPHEPDHVWASNSFLIAIDNAKDLFDEADEDNLSE